MITRLFTACGLAVVMGACASINTGAAPGEADAVVDLGKDDAAVQGLRPIETAALPDKSCGMILWMLEENRPAAVFRFVSSKQGEINIAGKPVTLTRTSYEGAAGYGVYERQTFESANGVTVEVSARFGLNFDGGAYLEHGLIKVRDANGWSMVAPTAGIAGCKN